MDVDRRQSGRWGFPGDTSSWGPYDWEAGDGRLAEHPTTCEPALVIILEDVYSVRPELADPSHRLDQAAQPPSNTLTGAPVSTPCTQIPSSPSTIPTRTTAEESGDHSWRDWEYWSKN